LFLSKIQYQYQKRKFEADFESLEKVAKNSCEKVINKKMTEKESFGFLVAKNFSANNFWGEFLAIFATDSKSASHSAFWKPLKEK
jgi:hypothetical protein